MRTSDLIQHLDRTMKAGLIRTDDGVELAYQTWGNGPALVIANGIGLRYQTFALQIPHWARSHQVVCWDYRGIGSSRPLPDGANLSIRRHAEDLAAVLDALNIGRATFLGWSMGSQVVAELGVLCPDRIVGFVSMAGTWRSPFSTALGMPYFRSTLSTIIGTAAKAPFLAQVILRPAPHVPRVVRFLKLIRWVGAGCDPDLVMEMVEQVAVLDKETFFGTLLEVDAHDATQSLRQFESPVLILSGGKDLFTPPKLARRMQTLFRDADLKIFQEGSHYVHQEYPEEVRRAVDGFLARISYRIKPERAYRFS